MSTPAPADPDDTDLLTELAALDTETLRTLLTLAPEILAPDDD